MGHQYQEIGPLKQYLTTKEQEKKCCMCFPSVPLNPLALDESIQSLSKFLASHAHKSTLWQIKASNSFSTCLPTAVSKSLAGYGPTEFQSLRNYRVLKVIEKQNSCDSALFPLSVFSCEKTKTKTKQTRQIIFPTTAFKSSCHTYFRVAKTSTRGEGKTRGLCKTENRLEKEPDKPSDLM